MRVAIVANYVVVRGGLRALVRAAGHEASIEVAADPRAAAMLDTLRCDVVLLDLTLTDVEAQIEICRLPSAHRGGPRVLGVEWSGRRPAQLQLLRATGLAGAVALTDSPGPLDAALVGVCSGQAVFLVPDPGAGLSASGRAPELYGPEVSERDVRVLQLLARGLRYREVAAALNCGESTVKHRVDALMARYDLPTSFVLGVWARAWHLVRLGSHARTTED